MLKQAFRFTLGTHSSRKSRDLVELDSCESRINLFPGSLRGSTLPSTARTRSSFDLAKHHDGARLSTLHDRGSHCRAHTRAKLGAVVDVLTSDASHLHGTLPKLHSNRSRVDRIPSSACIYAHIAFESRSAGSASLGTDRDLMHSSTSQLYPGLVGAYTWPCVSSLQKANWCYCPFAIFM